MTDRQLHVLAKEIRMAFATHAQGPVAAAMQRTADKDVAYLIEEYQRLRATLEQAQAENAAMRPVVEAVAAGETYHAETVDVWVLLFSNHTLSYAQEILMAARTFITAHPAQEDEETGE